MVKDVTNTTIERELKLKARAKLIGFSEALEFGLRFKLAELSEYDYPSNSLSYKIEAMAERLEEAHRRIEELDAKKSARAENNILDTGMYYDN